MGEKQKEYFSFPRSEDQSPLPDSRIPEDSPRFLAAKEQMRLEMGKDGQKTNDAAVTRMTHLWFVKQGMDANSRKEDEKRRSQA